MLFARPLTVYPQPTGFACPECGADVEIDLVTKTVANHEGEPEEHESRGYYCTNKSCTRYKDSIDDDEFTNPHTPNSHE